MKREIGYYWVKFYNHKEWKIMFWNTEYFKGFPGDRHHDELEQVDEKRITREH
jgi:hypothetical protein